MKSMKRYIDSNKGILQDLLSDFQISPVSFENKFEDALAEKPVKVDQ